MQIVRGDQIKLQIVLTNINNIQSAYNKSAILQSGDAIYIGKNKRDILSKSRYNLTALTRARLV